MKERLTGAIILVALIVLLVPELLSGPPQGGDVAASSAAAPQTPIAAVASARTLPHPSAAAAHLAVSSAAGGQPPIRSYTLPLGASGGSPASAGVIARVAAPGDPDPAATAQVKPPGTVKPPQTAPAAATALPAHQRQTAPDRGARPPAKVAGGWLVQLGYFSLHSNAVRLAHRVRGKGFHASISEHRVKGRTLWRVWSGPLRSRAAALQLARRLHTEGLKGEVLAR